MVSSHFWTRNIRDSKALLLSVGVIVEGLMGWKQ
jgi:hypothetical protein